MRVAFCRLRWKKNLHNIDLLMPVDYTFRDAVALLERLFNEYQAKQAKGKSPANS